MIGAVMGDMVGSVFEFRNVKTKDFPLFAPGGRFTDDTVMTLAVGQAVARYRENGGDLSELTAQSMRFWGLRYLNAGYGGRFLQWLQRPQMPAYNSFGNGSAMRVSACADSADSMEQALEYARLTAGVTHNHPDGIAGAQAAAAAGFIAKSGGDKEEIRRYVEREFYPLSFTLDEIRPSYRFDVSCRGSVPVAVQAFLESADYEDALRCAVSVGGDSDTIAAICGGIAWQYYRLHDPDFEQKTAPLVSRALALLPDELKQLLVSLEPDLPSCGKGLSG